MQNGIEYLALISTVFSIKKNQTALKTIK